MPASGGLVNFVVLDPVELDKYNSRTFYGEDVEEVYAAQKLYNDPDYGYF